MFARKKNMLLRLHPEIYRSMPVPCPPVYPDESTLSYTNLLNLKLRQFIRIVNPRGCIDPETLSKCLHTDISTIELRLRPILNTRNIGNRHLAELHPVQIAKRGSTTVCPTAMPKTLIELFHNVLDGTAPSNTSTTLEQLNADLDQLRDTYLKNSTPGPHTTN
eukprot:Lankesteria_metandrocarpae@DN4585_c0_g1_i1.p1